MKNDETTSKYLYFKNNQIVNDSMDLLKYSINDELSIKDDKFDYDFNNGFRIKFKDLSINYNLIIIDKTTRHIFFNDIIHPEENVIYSHVKKYYIEYEIIIQRVVGDTIIEPIPMKIIEYSPENKDILIFISGSEDKTGLGDTIAWLTAAYQFKMKHTNTNVTLCVSYPDIEEILLEKYSDVFDIIQYKDVKNKEFYASYLCGCFYSDVQAKDYCKVQYQKLSIHEIGCDVLGVEFDSSLLLDFTYESKKQSDKPYVCISWHASGIFKEWINYIDYDRIIILLQILGYDVYVIDREEHKTAGPLIKSDISKFAINKTGDISLKERAILLSGAEFFIGASTGLSWLAWACKIPVVMISGFTHPCTEFYTPYRVINYSVCNSCWNDESISENEDKFSCPRKKNITNPDFLECSMSINFYMVWNKICEIPSVREKMLERNLL